MHIPDGFLANRIALAMDVVSGAGVLYAARRIKIEASTRVIPLMGVLGAFVFAAQMLNFPVLGGTSGHLVGGALLAILLGPMAAFLTMATVIIAQALIMQDGGLIALGANIFNIGATTVLSGYLVFQLLGGPKCSGRRLSLAAFAAGWVSMILSAAGCAFQLAVSGVIPLKAGLGAMGGYHAVIGIMEGGLTAAVLAFLARVRPDLVERRGDARLGIPDWIGGIVFVALPFTLLVLIGSSELPDPLEKLLGSAAVAEASAAAQNLLQPQRFRAFFWEVMILLGLIAAAFAVTSLVRGKKGHHS